MAVGGDDVEGGAVLEHLLGDKVNNTPDKQFEHGNPKKSLDPERYLLEGFSWGECDRLDGLSRSFYAPPLVRGRLYEVSEPRLRLRRRRCRTLCRPANVATRK